MKKTKVAVGVIMAFGAIWTISSWFIGKQLENHIDEILQKANTQLNAYDPNKRLTINYRDYYRGLFSSKIKLVIQSSAQTLDNPLLQPNQSIVLNEIIDHGPFPFTQLKHGNLIPSMVSVHTELANTDAVQKLFDVTHGKSFIIAETRIGYSGKTDTLLNVQPVDYNNIQNGYHFATNGGKLQVRSDNKGNRITLKANFSKITVVRRNLLGQPVLFTLNGLKLDSDTYLSPEKVRLGDQTIVLHKLNASIKGQDRLTLEKMNGASSFKNKDGKIYGQIDYRVKSIKLQKQPFGEVKLVMKLSQVDALAVKAFSNAYNSQTQDLLKQSNEPIYYQTKIQTIFRKNLPILLKGSPSMSITPLLWKNEKGESSFSLSVRFNDPTMVNGAPQSTSALVDRVLQTLDGNININMPMATEVMRHVGLMGRIDGYQSDNPQNLAEQQVKSLAAMFQMFHLTEQHGDNIITSLQYRNGQVTMNGDKMTLDQFLAHYILGLETSNQRSL